MAAPPIQRVIWSAALVGEHPSFPPLSPSPPFPSFSFLLCFRSLFFVSFCSVRGAFSRPASAPAGPLVLFFLRVFLGLLSFFPFSPLRRVCALWFRVVCCSCGLAPDWLFLVHFGFPPLFATLRFQAPLVGTGPSTVAYAS